MKIAWNSVVGQFARVVLAGAVSGGIGAALNHLGDLHLPLLLLPIATAALHALDEYLTKKLA